MTAISASTTRGNIWTSFKTFFDGISYSTTPYIVSAYNDQDNRFPLIVLHSASVPKTKVTLDGSIEDRPDCTFVFEIHTIGGLQLDTILDEIDNAIQSDTTLESDGIQFKTEYWRESDAGTYLINNHKIHMKIITLSFELKNLT